MISERTGVALVDDADQYTDDGGFSRMADWTTDSRR